VSETEDEIYCLGHGHNPADGDSANCARCGNPIPPRGRFIPDDPCRSRVHDTIEAVIDAIEDTFLAHLPSKALSYCAQEDVWAGLDAMRERFGIDDEPTPVPPVAEGKA
jgi:hypothetical protein